MGTLTDGDKYELAVLAETEAAARQTYDLHAMRNTYGVEPAELARRGVEYLRAQEAWWAARDALMRAQMRMAKQ